MAQRCECDMGSTHHDANKCEDVGGLRQYLRVREEHDSRVLWLCWNCCLSEDQELFREEYEDAD